MVRDRFNALSSEELEEVKADYEDQIQDYYHRLHDWNSKLTPEESIAILRFEVDGKIRDRNRTKRRIERQKLRRGSYCINRDIEL